MTIRLEKMKKHPILTIAIALSMQLALAQSAVIDTAHIFQTKKLALNLDGARHAYHPNNEGLLHNLNGGIKQTEALENKFYGKRGYGIAKQYIRQGGYFKAYIQPDGYYISQTTTYFSDQPENSPERYADAETIPYITLSPGWRAKGVKNCDIAFVVNLDNGKTSAAIFADYRKNDEQLEISLALAKALDVPVSTKKGTSYDSLKTVKRYVGIANRRLKIYYFPNSGDGNGKTAEEIRNIAQRLMGL